MGADMIQCCSETLTYNSDEETDGSTEPLTKFAQEMYENHEANKLYTQTSDNNDNHHLNVPHSEHSIPTDSDNESESTDSRERSPSLSLSSLNNKKKSRRRHKKKSKSKHKKQKRPRSHSAYDDDSIYTETEELQSLKIQYEILKKQNQLFLTKHASYFSDNNNINNNDQTNQPLSLSMAHSMSSPHSISPLSISPLSINIAPSSNSNISVSPSIGSPLSVLSDKHTNIILSYSDSFPFPGAIKSRVRSYSVPISMNETALFEPDEKCQCVATCEWLKNVGDTMQLYSIIDTGDDIDEEILQSINANQLLADYQHILNQHLLGQQMEINMGIEYALIKAEINKQIEPCDIKTCNGYKRYMMGMQKKPNDDSFLLDLMDLIHCFLMHLECLQKNDINTKMNIYNNNHTKSLQISK